MDEKVFITNNGIKIVIDDTSDPRNVRLFDAAIRQNAYRIAERDGRTEETT